MALSVPLQGSAALAELPKAGRQPAQSRYFRVEFTEHCDCVRSKSVAGSDTAGTIRSRPAVRASASKHAL